MLQRFGVGFVLLLACRTVQPTPFSVLAELQKTNAGYLTGVPSTLAVEHVLNQEDFVYDAKLSHDGKKSAISRLGMTKFMVTLKSLDNDTTPPVDIAVNSLEFDVEAVEFSPDGREVVTISRDGSVRSFDSATGALRHAYLTDEKLSSLSVSASGEWLAVGSVKGLVTVLKMSDLSFQAEFRAHRDEVRGLVFAGDQTLYTGSWDKTIQRFSLQPSASAGREVRLGFEKKNGQQLFRGSVDNAVSVQLVLDERLPVTVLRSGVAAAAGLDTLQSTERISLPSASGTQVSRLFRNRQLRLKNLTLAPQDIAICDACLPPEAQGALGANALGLVSVATDAATQEMVFEVKDSRPADPSVSLALKIEKTFTFEASVNDLSIDRRHRILGVALSETKAERNRAVYEREKRKEVEPERPWDCAARVDAQTGVVLERKYGHRGVVASVGISPDGLTLASGGWDKRLLLHTGAGAPWVEKFGWAVRRVRFSRDGSKLVVAAWTPQNPLGDHKSDFSAVVYQVNYLQAVVEREGK